MVDDAKQKDSMMSEDQDIDASVAEAEATLHEEDDEVAKSNKVAETLNSLQALIERNANELDRLRQELKEEREKLKNIFDNDVELSEAQDIASKANVQIKERKTSIDNRPEVRQVKITMAEKKEEIKEIEETLNSHCINLFQLTGTSSFDTSDGDQREFELRAKVKPKKQK